MRVLFAITLISILFGLVSAQTVAPTYKPSNPTRKPSQKPTRAKYIYKTTEAEATANVAWSAVIGTLGFIVWQVTYYYKLKQDFICKKRREYLETRATLVLPLPGIDNYSI